MKYNKTITYSNYKTYLEAIKLDERIDKLNFNKVDDRYYFIYRITNTRLNKHYYGAKVSINKPINVIGITYFSSSTDKEFKQDQKDNPQDYKYKVVRTFNNTGDKQCYESFLHQYFNVGVNNAFYNKSKQTPFGFDTTGNREIAIERGKKSSKTKQTQEWKDTIGKQAIIKCKETKQSEEWKNTIGKESIRKRKEHGLSLVSYMNIMITNNALNGKKVSLAKQNIIWKDTIGKQAIKKKNITENKPLILEDGNISTIKLEANKKHSNTKQSEEWRAENLESFALKVSESKKRMVYNEETSSFITVAQMSGIKQTISKQEMTTYNGVEMTIQEMNTLKMMETKSTNEWQSTVLKEQLKKKKIYDEALVFDEETNTMITNANMIGKRASETKQTQEWKDTIGKQATIKCKETTSNSEWKDTIGKQAKIKCKETKQEMTIYNGVEMTKQEMNTLKYSETMDFQAKRYDLYCIDKGLLIKDVAYKDIREISKVLHTKTKEDYLGRRMRTVTQLKNQNKMELIGLYTIEQLAFNKR